MNKFLRYSFVALLAMFGLNTYAGDVTIAANSSTFLASGDDYVATQDGVTITYSKGNSTTAISGGIKDNQIRVYKNAILTISSSQTISKIVVTAVINNQIGADGFVAEGYAAADDKLTGTWTGSSNSVTLTASVGQVRITQVVVTVGGAPSVTVAAPTIDGLTPFAGSTQVTITNNEAGASVYYTTDGTTPTASSTAYLTPFTITETTTVKAIAIKDEVSSSVASKTFTAVSSVNNIAALNALENGSVFAFTGEPLVVYVSGKYAYIKDETGSSLIYSNDADKLANLEKGKKVAANWTGKVSVYNNLFEAVPDATLNAVAGDPVAVSYPEAEVADVIAANMNQVVFLSNVTYTAPEEGSKNFTITKGETTLNGYNQFGLEIAAPAEGKLYDIAGVISIYKENIQFQPIAIMEVIPEVELPVVEAQPVYKFTAKGQWASYTFNKANFKAATIVGFRIEYSNMTEKNEGAAFNILVNSAETHLGKDWSGSDAQVPNKTAYKNVNFDSKHTVFTGDFAEFVATGDPATTCPTIGQFALQACDANNTVVIKKVVFIKKDGTEILPEYKGDDWGGGAYTVEEVTDGINNVTAAKAENAVRYNLAGQKVNNDYKGVVIMNGKKMLNK